MRKIAVLMLALMFAAAGAARADNILIGVGGRVGVTLDPDQVHFGFHADLGALAENVVLRPNVEVGVGSDMTILALNPEVVYLFKQSRRKNYLPYAGGGLGFNITDHNGKGMAGDTEFGVGLNVLGGLQFETTESSSLFVEAKFGVGESPNVKLTFGFTLTR